MDDTDALFDALRHVADAEVVTALDSAIRRGPSQDLARLKVCF